MMKGRVVWTRVPLSSSDFRTSHFLFPTNSQCSSFYCSSVLTVQYFAQGHLGMQEVLGD